MKHDFLVESSCLYFLLAAGFQTKNLGISTAATCVRIAEKSDDAGSVGEYVEKAIQLLTRLVHRTTIFLNLGYFLPCSSFQIASVESRTILK